MAYTFNTGNPVGPNGSADPRDLVDNSQVADRLITSTGLTVPDRLGVPRKTWAGMENQFDAAQVGRAADFDVAQSAREGVFNAYLVSAGYQFTGDYAAGIQIAQYNQVVRDTNGEFWRASGSTTLPYTTTGAGMPEGGAFVSVGDAALRQQLAATDSDVLVGGVEARIIGQGTRLIQGPPAPFYGVTTTSHSVLDRRVISIIDGWLYADTGTQLVRSADMGDTWEVVRSFTSRWFKFLKCDDGEILAINGGNGVQRTTGWAANPSTAVFNEVLTMPTLANILRWGFDGDGTKFIATHYSASNRSLSRYAYISTDGGVTWTQVWDSVDKFGAESADASHIHAACYDKYNDRFWICEGHLNLGIYYSENNGVTWLRADNPATTPFPTAAPTTMTATPYGVVCGTDSFPDGVYTVRGKGADGYFNFELLYHYRSLTNSLNLQCDASVIDPDTGMVYIVARGFSSPAKAVVMASNGESAGLVYEFEDGAAISNIAVSQGKFFLNRLTSPQTSVQGFISKVGSRDDTLVNNGNILTENVVPNLSMAVGADSEAKGVSATAIGLNAKAGTVGGENHLAIGRNTTIESGQRNIIVGNNSSQTGTASGCTIVGQSVSQVNVVSSVAIGNSTETPASNTVAVGHAAKARGSQATSVGKNADCAAGNSVAVGYNSSTTATNSTALGAAATAGSTGTSVGYNAKAGANSLALGVDANASGSDQTAIGRSAVSGTSGTAVGLAASSLGNLSVAVGRNASAGHAASVALGANSATVRADSVCVGNRDIESTRNGGRIYLKSPNGTLYYISINDTGTLTATAV